MQDFASPSLFGGAQWPVAHTVGHVMCPACELQRANVLQSLTPDLFFEVAAKRFIELRSIDAAPGAITARYVRKNTELGYERQMRSLDLFFHGMRLGDIHWWHMRSYQQARVAGATPFIRYRRPQDKKPRKMPDGSVLPPKGPTPSPVKPAQVNQELAFLKRLKRLSGCWNVDDDNYYQELQEEESEVPRALTPEQQGLWLDVSRQQEHWMIVHWYSILAFETCASTNELRGLRLGDISIPMRSIRVPWPAAKNKYRHRDIAIESADALWALERLIERAHEKGAAGPMQYLFPFRDHRFVWHPDKPATMQFLKKPWDEVRMASHLQWFRPYDTRHTAATRLAENGVPVDIILARMGHCNDRMRRHYTHISMQAQRRWLRPQPANVNPYSGLPLLRRA